MGSDGYPALKMKKKALKAAAVSGAYEGSVPFIIDVNMDFTSDSAVDADINVKVASVRVTCPGEVYSSDGSLITFPNAPTDGDCLGDGVRSDGKDASKYNLNINDDGTLTFNSDGYPALKMKKKSLKASDKLSGSYEGSVPFIIDVTADFDGSDKADVDVNVKVASTRITCPGESIAETDAQVTFPNAPNDGDCLGDGIRSDSKDPSKYIILKNSDGTLTYKSDGYPDLKMTKKSLKAADALSGSYEGSVPFIIDVTADFDGSGAKADVDVNVKV